MTNEQTVVEQRQQAAGHLRDIEKCVREAIRLIDTGETVEASVLLSWVAQSARETARDIDVERAA